MARHYRGFLPWLPLREGGRRWGRLSPVAMSCFCYKMFIDISPLLGKSLERCLPKKREQVLVACPGGREGVKCPRQAARWRQCFVCSGNSHGSQAKSILPACLPPFLPAFFPGVFLSLLSLSPEVPLNSATKSSSCKAASAGVCPSPVENNTHTKMKSPHHGKGGRGGIVYLEPVTSQAGISPACLPKASVCLTGDGSWFQK